MEELDAKTVLPGLDDFNRQLGSCFSFGLVVSAPDSRNL